MKAFFQKIWKFEKHKNIKIERKIVYSTHVGRDFVIDICLPPAYDAKKTIYPLLLLNDGQDFAALQMEATLKSLYEQQLLRPTIVVGIHANENRLQEYGTAHQADYAQRGGLAGAYTAFVVTELLPFLSNHYRLTTKREERAIAGFSLGGLSAFDIAWQNASIFSKVGVFSGSLWWRSEPFDSANPDGHRIAHDMVARSEKREGLQFWFQTGTLDEASDRNNNGIIDAIDDTLDLIQALRQKGYTDADLTYVEIEGGEHNPQTWGKAMLAFLLWVL
jgi:enterochelin esterase-like enzyme